MEEKRAYPTAGAVVSGGRASAWSEDLDEARLLLDSIDTSSVMGLRDRALIALMAYTFARVGAAVAMKVEDYFILHSGTARLGTLVRKVR